MGTRLKRSAAAAAKSATLKSAATPKEAKAAAKAETRAETKAKAETRAEAKAETRQPLPLDPRARTAARVTLAIALVAIGLWTAAEFLSPLIWAGVLAVALWPLYEQAAQRLSGGPSTLSALLFTALVALVVFVPLALATVQLAEQSTAIGAWITQARDNGIQVPEWVARLPVAADAAQAWWKENLAKPESAKAWLQSLNADGFGDIVKTFGGQLLQRGFMFFVALLALFVLLRSGETVARQLLRTADGLFGEPGEGLAQRTVTAIRGTVNGTVVVALAEGLLIGAGYFVAGVPNPILFTVLTVAFAMLPFGAWAAFGAAALTLLAAGGSPVMALALFAWGAAIMLAGDHFVWPVMVGGAARLPFLLAFVGIFGGLASFGLLGLFVGPVIMAMIMSVWREWVLRSAAAAE
jgi:predicted PurR-regulated permease PerM